MARTGKNLEQFQLGKPGCSIEPGRNPGAKTKKGKWDKVEDGICQLVSMSLDIFRDTEDQETFRNHLRIAALDDPGGYLKHVFVPIIRALPPDLRERILKQIVDAGVKQDMAMALEIVAVALDKAKDEGIDLDVIEDGLRSDTDGEGAE